MRHDAIHPRDHTVQGTCGSRAVTFITSGSGRACLSNWAQPLALTDILNLLLDLKQTVALAGGPLRLILVIGQTVPVPADFLLSSLQAGHAGDPRLLRTDRDRRRRDRHRPRNRFALFSRHPVGP